VSELRITPEPADGAPAVALLERYYAELDVRFPGGFSLEQTVAAPADELTPPRGLFLVARLRGVAVGCGGVRALEADVAEIKRMWVDPAARGAGVGRGLLTGLEAAAAADLGARTVRLDTAASLTEALGLYRSAGYREIAAYNDNPYAAHWLERTLV
jgi:ribosomal protein S18 acetylase RimI-like enzyme